MPKRSKNQQAPTLFNPKAAGRPKLNDRKLKWIRRNGRSSIAKNTPVHVTVKLKPQVLASLRTKQVFKQFKLALQRARAKGLRILHFSLQRDHVHLLIEARDQRTLSRGMQSFGVSFALSLKKLSRHIGPGVFKDRYHVKSLTSPTQVKRVLHYIARNGFKHKVVPTLADCYSSSIVMKRPKLDFSTYFVTQVALKEFRRQMTELVDLPVFWLSKQGA